MSQDKFCRGSKPLLNMSSFVSWIRSLRFCSACLRATSSAKRRFSSAANKSASNWPARENSFLWEMNSLLGTASYGEHQCISVCVGVNARVGEVGERGGDSPQDSVCYGPWFLELVAEPMVPSLDWVQTSEREIDRLRGLCELRVENIEARIRNNRIVQRFMMTSSLACFE